MTEMVRPTIEGDENRRSLIARAVGAVADTLTLRRLRFEMMVNICEDQVRARDARDEDRTFSNDVLDGYADDLGLSEQQRSDAFNVAKARVEAAQEAK